MTAEQFLELVKKHRVVTMAESWGYEVTVDLHESATELVRDFYMAFVTVEVPAWKGTLADKRYIAAFSGTADSHRPRFISMRDGALLAGPGEWKTVKAATGHIAMYGRIAREEATR